MHRLLIRLIIFPVILLNISSAHAAEKTHQGEVEDLFFGEALYHAYQSEYFNAISRLDTELMQYYVLDEQNLSSLYHHIGDAEFSVGDYVVSGGELPAMLLIDAVTRLIPGVLGHGESAKHDSFMDGLLDFPHYTRPEIYQGLAVPPLLLSGDHGAVDRWRLRERLGRTQLRRPDLVQALDLTNEQQQLLSEYLALHGGHENEES